MKGHPGPLLAYLGPSDPATCPFIILNISVSDTSSRVNEKAVSVEVAAWTEVVREAVALGVTLAVGLAGGQSWHIR